MNPVVLSILVLVAVGKANAARLLDGRQGATLHAAQLPPKWPDAYEMEYTLSLPYVQTMQPGGLKYPVHVWWDGPAQRYRFDVYGGMDSMGWDLQQGFNWNLYPRITEVTCDFTNGTSGPTATSGQNQQQQLMALLGLGLKEGESASPLPDISDWSYAGTAQVRNADALVWQFSVRNGEKTANYQFYTARNGWPLRFYMMGRNLITGSHFDEYVIEFTRFKPGPVAAAAFALPEVCSDVASRRQQQQHEGAAEMFGAEMSGVAARLAALMPAARLGAGPVFVALDELHAGAESALEANARFVDEHNRRVREAAAAAAAATTAEPDATISSTRGSSSAPTPSYTLGLNHWAHLTHQQWAAGMLGLKKRNDAAKDTAACSARPRVGSAARGTYQRVLTDEQLPAFVDWRGTGADGPGVKDQVSCGSCWAFAASGAMQGAWFKATGQSLSLSEQQLVDCAWDYGNNGCAGGFVEPTLQYVVDAGGIAQEADYPYLAQNSFCKGPIVTPQDAPTTAVAAGTGAPNATGISSGGLRAAVRLSASFSGFVNVSPRDEGALMEAVALHGPVAVLMNAALPPFRFYSEGVYYNEQCGQDPDSMDHAILLVGYGTSPEGVDYWLIKNSWSKYWGMDGYARVARKGNDCGITTDPVLAVVDPKAALDATKSARSVTAATATTV